MGARSQALLPQRSYRTRRQQEGLKVRALDFQRSSLFVEAVVESMSRRKKEIKWLPESAPLRTSSAPP